MKFAYETVGTTTFLTYVGQADEFDPFSLKMLEHNEVEGLLSFSSILENRMRKIRYVITSYETLESYISRPLPLANILNILESIAGAAAELEEYMLYPGGIVAEPEYMYTEIGTGKTRLVYLPIKECGETDIFTFLRGLMGKVQYADPESAVCVLKISNDMNSGKITGTASLLEAVKEAKRELKGKGKKEAGMQTGRMPQEENQTMGKSPVLQPEKSEKVRPVQDAFASQVSFAVPGDSGRQADEKEQRNESRSGFHFFGTKKKAGKEEKKEKEEEKKKQKEEKKPEKGMISPGFAIPGMEPASVPQTAEPQEQEKRSAEKKGFLSFKRKEKEQKTPLESEKAQRGKTAVPPAAAGSGNIGLDMPGQQSVPQFDFGSTILEQPDDEVTMVDGLTDMPEGGIACLFRRANGQRMYLEQEITRIGRESAYVDFYIGDNPRIGRSHAEIVRRGNTYYIKDNHSKNHTYVNGEMVAGEEMIPLKAGDVIMLANEVFEYRED